MKKKKVVVFGGGNGTMCSLFALKQHLDVFDISAVVAMSDSGGSQGRLREEFNVPPTSDLMRAVLAMSSFDSTALKEIFFKKRFSGCGKLSGHNLGNLFMFLTREYCCSLMDTVEALSQAVGAVGKVVPCTLDNVHLVAEMEDGREVFGEADIDRPNQTGENAITKVYLSPEAKACEGAVNEINHADFLIFGPGSLFCSVIASILPTGICSAINESNAKLIFIPSNKYEIDGELGPKKLGCVVKAIESYLPRQIDLLVFNDCFVTDKRKEYYIEKRWSLLKYDKADLLARHTFVQDFEKETGGMDPIKLGAILRNALT